MSVLVLGLNHKTASVELLERVAVPDESLQKALTSLVQCEHVSEAAVLSTCNRVEIYASVSRYHGGLSDLRTTMARWAGMAPEDFLSHTYDYFDEGAARHLFAVASGLDSMVYGERQINLQVKEAFKRAQEEQTVGRMLQTLFSQALRAARRVRMSTDIGNGASSMIDLGLELARRDLDGLDGRDVLLIGAGKMAGMAATRLVEGAASVTVANRSPERAQRLVERIGPSGRAASLDDLAEVLATVDLAVASTGAVRPLVRPDMVTAGGDRSGRPLVLMDLAVPRDIDPDCDKIPGVTVRNVEDLRALVATGPTGGDLEAAHDIVADEARRFQTWRSSVRAEPTITALRARAELVRRGEIERLSGRLGDLDGKQTEALDALTRGIVNTLLHEPTVRLKQLSDGDNGSDYALALRELFDLPE